MKEWVWLICIQLLVNRWFYEAILNNIKWLNFMGYFTLCWVVVWAAICLIFLFISFFWLYFVSIRIDKILIAFILWFCLSGLFFMIISILLIFPVWNFSHRSFFVGFMINLLKWRIIFFLYFLNSFISIGGFVAIDYYIDAIAGLEWAFML